MTTGASGRQRFGRFEVLLTERRLHVDGQPVALGSRAFELLAALVERRDRVVTKDELIDVVWPGLVVEENNLQVQISALRKVLGAPAIATLPGRGYRFALAPGEPEPAAVPSPPPRAAVRQATTASGAPVSRLLLADDNKVNRLLLGRTLELMGHEVETAADGRRALERLRGERFDLLLLDLEMPELDGFGLLEARAGDAALREVPVIVTSSLEGVAHVARCIELGADDYLHKPINPVLLKARVEASLERKHLRDRERARLARLEPGLDETAADGTAAGARRAAGTVLVARLRGFEALSTSRTPGETMELLNGWTTLVVDAVEGRGGVVARMEGDGLAAMFGIGPDAAAGAGAATAAATAAVAAALETVELTAMLEAERAGARRSDAGSALDPGIGVATGEVLVGRAGTSRRTAFVCLGPAAQRADALARDACDGDRRVRLDAASHAATASSVAAEPADAAGTVFAPSATSCCR